MEAAERRERGERGEQGRRVISTHLGRRRQNTSAVHSQSNSHKRARSSPLLSWRGATSGHPCRERVEADVWLNAIMSVSMKVTLESNFRQAQISVGEVDLFPSSSTDETLSTRGPYFGHHLELRVSCVASLYILPTTSTRSFMACKQYNEDIIHLRRAALITHLRRSRRHRDPESTSPPARPEKYPCPTSGSLDVGDIFTITSRLPIAMRTKLR